MNATTKDGIHQPSETFLVSLFDFIISKKQTNQKKNAEKEGVKKRVNDYNAAWIEMKH